MLWAIHFSLAKLWFFPFYVPWYVLSWFFVLTSLNMWTMDYGHWAMK
jgi:hypothetical protein